MVKILKRILLTTIATTVYRDNVIKQCMPIWDGLIDTVPLFIEVPVVAATFKKLF